VFNREGGSIPVVSTFQEELGLPSLACCSASACLMRTRIAPDEKLDLGTSTTA
jgi:hypothetical protein